MSALFGRRSQKLISRASFVQRLLTPVLWAVDLLLVSLYAGLVFVNTAALPFAPILHRLSHHLHGDDGGRR